MQKYPNNLLPTRNYLEFPLVGLLNGLVLTEIYDFLEKDESQKSRITMILNNHQLLKWISNNSSVNLCPWTIPSLIESRNIKSFEKRILQLPESEMAFWNWLMMHSDETNPYVFELSRDLSAKEHHILLEYFLDAKEICSCKDKYTAAVEYLNLQTLGLCKKASIHQFNYAFDIFQGIRRRENSTRNLEGQNILDCLVQKNGFFQKLSRAQIDSYVSKLNTDQKGESNTAEIIEGNQSHLCFHLSKCCLFLEKLIDQNYIFDDLTSVGIIFSLLTVFYHGISPDFLQKEIRISPSMLANFTPQLHGMIFSRDKDLIRLASNLFRKLTDSERHAYVKLEICAEWYFASTEDLQNEYHLLVKSICTVKEIEAMTLFMDGLSRISTTWEEKWFVELQKNYSSLTKFFRRIRPHILQLVSSDLCDGEKDSLLHPLTNLLKHLMKDFEDLLLLTESEVLKTPAGISFWGEYGDKIRNLSDEILFPIRVEEDLEKKRLLLKTVGFTNL